MMKKYLLFIFLILFSFSAFAQGSGQPIQIQRLQNWSQESRILKNGAFSNIDGSPFYNEDWRIGYVMINKKQESNAVKLRYSSYTNELLFQENGKTMVLPSNKFIGFAFTDQKNKITFKNGFKSPEYDIKPDQLMRVIYDGNVQLLAKEYTFLNKDKDPFTGEMKYKFLPKRDYFIATQDGNLHKIKLKDKDIYKVLGHKAQLKKYADQHDIDFGQEDDVKTLLSAYGEMLKKSK